MSVNISVKSHSDSSYNKAPAGQKEKKEKMFLSSIKGRYPRTDGPAATMEPFMLRISVNFHLDVPFNKGMTAQKTIFRSIKDG